MKKNTSVKKLSLRKVSITTLSPAFIKNVIGAGTSSDCITVIGGGCKPSGASYIDDCSGLRPQTYTTCTLK
ncbi:class I lanthipeptide [Taibaiella chishuiensis]|uniref:class I lanthipeptide n=1 Tax=Taibaiella chishuiensis TaxID=1434707 RepID=UPI001C62C649